MKLKKKDLKRLLERCHLREIIPDDDQEETRWGEQVNSEVVRALVQEVLRHRKRRKRRRKRQMELRLCCAELEEYVESGDITEDGISKRYGYIGDLAVTAFLGAEFVERLNELL